MRGVREDRGAAAIEFAAILPTALLVILVCYQAYVASTTVERVENAARSGARVASQRYDPALCRPYAERALPKEWLTAYRVEGGATTVGGDAAVSCRVEAKLPLLFKGLPVDFTVRRTVTMALG
ncbi:TadE/TadG family type IV pilus assembly protein [Actinomadura flavalba]|uniref:TadE/TadG family type IV pilus assembly protein n=1 Tax=Actinomadura flavalba TaxID=1120938 RepID=UPI00036B4C37|nr:TadE/TadG family type IV pilus assembly protein [Actinomadura flavalba]